MAFATDGSGFEVVDDLGLMSIPTGVGATADAVYISDADPEASSDVYVIRY